VGAGPGAEKFEAGGGSLSAGDQRPDQE
jgi:hypothetical protein